MKTKVKVYRFAHTAYKYHDGTDDEGFDPELSDFIDAKIKVVEDVGGNKIVSVGHSAFQGFALGDERAMMHEFIIVYTTT